ncbi:MAG: hypothetical protein AAB674_01350, partial [Patescibacteria group bacterium]
NSDGSVGPWATSSNALPAARQAHTSVVTNGYAYVIGGYNSVSQTTVYYAKLNSNGSTGAWATNANALPADRSDHSSVVANGYVYVLGGYSNTPVSTVYYAKLNSDGSVGAWSTNANALPSVNRYPSSVVANGYVYTIGGYNGTSGLSTISYSSLPRVSISGNLDLLGLASTTLADANDSDWGSTGSSIFAGNIYSAGKLQVTGNALFSNGVGINGVLSVNATSSGVQNVPIFSVQNATATAPILTVLYNGNVGINKAAPVSALDIVGTCADTGAGCADYAELYPSSETVEPGDIVSLDLNNSGKVKKSVVGELEPIGAVSSNPAILIEGSGLQMLSGINYKSDPNKPAIALSGKIPVKVNLEGGEIQVGDPITISSVPGIGKKATTSARIIGYALENYSSQSNADSQTSNVGKILVFASQGYWMGRDILALGSLALSSSNGLNGFGVTGGEGASIIDAVKAWFESMGIIIRNGFMSIKEISVDILGTNVIKINNEFTLGTAERPIGITIYDQSTGDPYCVGMKDGQLQTMSGACNSAATASLLDSAASTTSSSATTTDSTTLDTMTLDSISPTITLNGPAVVEIEKGSAWTDPGATVVDPAVGDVPANTNLSIYYKLDGVETANGGREPVQIDISVLGSHIIIYSATDSAGNIGTATRTVNVVASIETSPVEPVISPVEESATTTPVI